MSFETFETITFICPIFVTGGTEAIHQACVAFTQAGKPAQIAYLNEGATITRAGDLIECHAPAQNRCVEAFRHYQPVVADRIVLSPSNLVVVPEVFALSFDDFLPATFGVWWLSVDNMFNHNREMLDEATRSRFFARQDFVHLYQSHYARQFLRQVG